VRSITQAQTCRAANNSAHGLFRLGEQELL
jgi:hypothetical protein